MLGCFQHSLREERQEFSQHAASLMSSLVLVLWRILRRVANLATGGFQSTGFFPFF